MTRDDKIAEANRLHDAGLSDREISERMGITKSAVWKWRHPERVRELRLADDPDRVRRRAWERAPANRGDCVECGGKRGISQRTDGLCANCVTKRSKERRAEFVRLRNEDGLTNREIAARLGLPAHTIATEIYRARAWDGLKVLPCRRGRPFAA